MRGRFSVVIAGLALAVGGGIAGAVVVAPSLQPDGSLAVRQAAGKDALATPQHTFHVAKKARGMARGARQLANGLVDQVDQVQSDATQALNLAGVANSRLDALSGVSDTENGAVSTAEENQFVSRGGPEVTVNVPASGQIQVSATVRFGDPADGMVALFEDGQQVPLDQTQLCTGFGEPLDDVLLLSSLGSGEQTTLSTPPAMNPFGCGIPGRGAAPLLLNRPPGNHTYELRYADCGCDPGDALFSNRVLRVATVP